VRIDDKEVCGSPLQIVLVSDRPDLSKSELTGKGLKAATAGEKAHIKLKFVDAFGNIAQPGPALTFGLALEKERQKLSSATESMPFDGAWEPGDKGVHLIEFMATPAGQCQLHVWSDFEPEAGQRTRTPFPGSPFAIMVSAGPASPAVSRVDGWVKMVKEERSIATKKEATALDNSLIIAGDSISIKPQVYDAFGNPAALPEGELHVTHDPPGQPLPNGRMKPSEHVEMPFTSQQRGGQTTYEIKHEATVAGVHRIHICLGELPILGSPLSFFVQPDRPEPSLCKLYPPQDPLYSEVSHTFVLITFDRYLNKCLEGGLVLTSRLQLIKQSVHDQTALTPMNHSLVVEDRADGTYHIVISAQMVCSLRLVINLDKNLPNNGGELPGLTVHFVADPERPGSARSDEDKTKSPIAKSESPTDKGKGKGRRGSMMAGSSGGDMWKLAKESSLERDSFRKAAAEHQEGESFRKPKKSDGDASPKGSPDSARSPKGGSPDAMRKNERLRNAANELMMGFGAADDRRDKGAVVIAAEAFASGGAFTFDGQRTDGLFDKARESSGSGDSSGSPLSPGASGGSISAFNSAASGMASGGSAPMQRRPNRASQNRKATFSM